MLCQLWPSFKNYKKSCRLSYITHRHSLSWASTGMWELKPWNSERKEVSSLTLVLVITVWVLTTKAKVNKWECITQDLCEQRKPWKGSYAVGDNISNPPTQWWVNIRNIKSLWKNPKPSLKCTKDSSRHFPRDSKQWARCSISLVMRSKSQCESVSRLLVSVPQKTRGNTLAGMLRKRNTHTLLVGT